MSKAKTATKTMLQHLRTMDTEQAELLQEIVEMANNAQALVNDGYDINSEIQYKNDDVYGTSITGIVTSEYKKRLLTGLRSRYENLVSTTFTHGNNGFEIHDINQLVKMLMAENPPICKTRKLFTE